MTVKWTGLKSHLPWVKHPGKSSLRAFSLSPGPLQKHEAKGLLYLATHPARAPARVDFTGKAVSHQDPFQKEHYFVNARKR